MATGTPDCSCHGEPMYWNRHSRPSGGWWSCAVQQRDRVKARYEAMDGVSYNRLLLQHRRAKAVRRQRNREVLSG